MKDCCCGGLLEAPACMSVICDSGFVDLHPTLVVLLLQ